MDRSEVERIVRLLANEIAEQLLQELNAIEATNDYIRGEIRRIRAKLAEQAEAEAVTSGE